MVIYLSLVHTSRTALRGTLLLVPTPNLKALCVIILLTK